MNSRGRCSRVTISLCPSVCLVVSQGAIIIYIFGYVSTNASMTDLSTVLPDFDTQSYIRLIPPLERNNVTVADLLTLGSAEVAKRAQVPLLDVKRLSKAITERLQQDLGITTASDGKNEVTKLRKDGTALLDTWNTISTLDDELDQALGGGLPAGYITEITGERYRYFIKHWSHCTHTNSIQRRRKDTIPPYPPARCTTALTTRSRITSSLHLYGIRTSHATYRSTPSVSSTLQITAYNLTTLFRSHNLNHNPRSRITRAHPPLPSPCRHPTTRRAPAHHR